MRCIAIVGKGGSGKTTISGTLARLTARRLGGLLAIDGDPNPNLATVLGIAREGQWPLLPPDLLARAPVEGGGTRVELAQPFAAILDRYGVDGPDGVRLLALGEVENAGKGWLCRNHAVVRELVGSALEEMKKPVVIDMEASVEHMRRGTARHVDTLLVVTEPYYRALEAAGRLIRLARELGIENVQAVANKVRSDDEEQAIRAYLERLDVPLAAVVPFDPAVGEADLDGRSLLDLRPDCDAVRVIEQLAARVVN